MSDDVSNCWEGGGRVGALILGVLGDDGGGQGGGGGGQKKKQQEAEWHVSWRGKSEVE